MAEWFDIDNNGEENEDGSPVVYYGKYAIQRAVIKFLSSKKGDYIYLPNLGGILEEALFKNMTPDNKIYLESIIYKELIRYFKDAVENLAVVVNPDFELDMWDITISYSDKLNDNTLSTIFISAQSEDVSGKFSQKTDVNSEGDNLITDINYIRENDSSVEGQILKYNFTESVFEWGNYRLTNFTVNSDNFSEVLLLING